MLCHCSFMKGVLRKRVRELLVLGMELIRVDMVEKWLRDAGRAGRAMLSLVVVVV